MPGLTAGIARLSIAGAALAALGTATPALGNATYMLSLRGEVATICRAEIRDLALVGETGETAATLSEFCNSASGYKVYATASDESLRVRVDGRDIVADADGRYLLASETRPNIGMRDLTISGAQSGTISITVIAA